MLWLWCFVAIAGFRSGVSGRGVNVSDAWFLPRESFPVFYRYFREKVTWEEAEATCEIHRADLMSVETSLRMDAARAYLKEIDVTDNIWIGLRKEPAQDYFSWGNGERVAEDGYWIGPIPKSEEKLCVAIDPVSDFRWTTFFCGGPQVASFVCEMPVPDWAKNENGCMIPSMPTLTVTLMPETGVVQLFSDCGPEGTRRLACKGNANREEMLKRLSCDGDASPSTVFGESTTDAVGDVRKKASGESAFPPQTRHRRQAEDYAVTSPQTDADVLYVDALPSRAALTESDDADERSGKATTEEPPASEDGEPPATDSGGAATDFLPATKEIGREANATGRPEGQKLEPVHLFKIGKSRAQRGREKSEEIRGQGRTTPMGEIVRVSLPPEAEAPRPGRGRRSNRPAMGGASD